MKFKLPLLAGALLLIAQTASAAPFSYGCTDCPWTIGPDPGSITSTITVTDSGTIADLDLFVDMFHTWSGDLVITLEHHGTSVTVHDTTGGSTDYLPTLYEDLLAFVGHDLAGDWILTVEDTLFGDEGVLANWTISGTADTTSAPEPGILILMGLGLAGLGFARRRR